MSNIVNLFSNSEEFKENNIREANKALSEVWQDKDVIEALKQKVLEHISNLSGFDMTYQTGFKERVMPLIFSDDDVQALLKNKFLDYLNQDDINYDLGEALSMALFKKFGVEND